MTSDVTGSATAGTTKTIDFTVTSFKTNQQVVEDTATNIAAKFNGQHVALTRDVSEVAATANTGFPVFPATLFGITKISLNIPADTTDIKTTVNYSHPKIDEDGVATIIFKVTRAKGTANKVTATSTF